MELSNLNIKEGFCISLGANLEGPFGKPIESLIKSKSMVEDIIIDLINHERNKKVEINSLNNFFNWSSFYKTKPLGTNKPQSDYINCLLLARGPLMPTATPEKAKLILKKFQNLEVEFGRNKFLEDEKWLPRPLDLDIIWWDNLHMNDQELTLPHPRFKHRNFVITPLAEVLNLTQEVEKLNLTR